MLAKHADDLLPTEIPANVYEGLKASPVTDVHVFGRRGPAQVKFTPLELRELGELNDVDMIVYDEDFDYDEASKARDREQQAGHGDRQGAHAVAPARGRARRPAGCTCTSTRKPVEIARRRTGVAGVPSTSAPSRMATGGVRGTGEIREVADPGALPRCRLLRVAARRHPVRREARRDPEPRGSGARRRRTSMHGVYATGWIKRGPVGLIGHTKSRRDGDDQARHQRPGQLVDAGDPTRRRSSSCSTSAASSTRTSTAGTTSTQHELALGEAGGPHPHQGRRRATRWSRSRGGSNPAPTAGRGEPRDVVERASNGRVDPLLEGELAAHAR